MALAMMATMSTAALATFNNNQAGDSDGVMSDASTILRIRVDKAKDLLVATVPAALDFVVDTRGDVIVPTNATIQNNCNKAIQVKQISLTSLEENTTTDIEFVGKTAYQKWNSTEKAISITFNGSDGGTSARNARLRWNPGSAFKIEANKSLPLTLDVKCSKGVYQNTTTMLSTFGTATFTIGFAE